MSPIPRWHAFGVCALVFAGIMALSCMFARSAFAASAPLCDDRGASAIAPPPALQSPEDAIERIRSCASVPSLRAGLQTRVVSCPLFGDDALHASVGPAHRTFHPPSPQVGGALLIALLSIAPAAVTAVERTPIPRGAPSGVRSRVDRPPRG